MASLTIREYRDSDEAAVLALARQLQAYETPMNPYLKPVEDMGPWYITISREWCAKNEGLMLVAEQNGELVGYVWLMTKCEEDGRDIEVAYTFAHVADLVVAEDKRGQGIGTAMLAECERIAKACGRSVLRLSVMAQNEAAQSVYQRFGFAPRRFLMEKKLT